MRVCGIDPGKSGAVCILDTDSLVAPVLLDLDKSTIYEVALWMHNQDIDIVFLEDVHSIFGMSAKSNFSFGKNLGVVTALAQVVTKGKPTEYVTPKVWQKFIGVTAKGKAIKTDVANIARHMYPSIELYGPQGGLKDGRADALMITHYGINHLP